MAKSEDICGPSTTSICLEVSGVSGAAAAATAMALIKALAHSDSAVVVDIGDADTCGPTTIKICITQSGKSSKQSVEAALVALRALADGEADWGGPG